MLFYALLVSALLCSARHVMAGCIRIARSIAVGNARSIARPPLLSSPARMLGASPSLGVLTSDRVVMAVRSQPYQTRVGEFSEHGSRQSTGQWSGRGIRAISLH